MDHFQALWGDSERHAFAPETTSSITLRNAQVPPISWVRGVRPVRERYEWPPHDAAPGRPPLFHRLEFPIRSQNARGRPSGRPRSPRSCATRYLILASRNSTCFLATGSYLFLVSFSVIVREFFRVT